MDNPNSAAILAAALYAAFQEKTRDNGETFITLKDGAPAWATDAVREAHGDSLPDDTVYATCRAAASDLTDTDPKGWEDACHQFADSHVSVYHVARIQWLAANPHAHMAYCDDAQDNGLAGDGADLSDRIAAGWYEQARTIFDALARAITREADANPCAWVAGWNMPGFLPEMDVQGFETWQEAADFLYDAIEREAEDVEDAQPEDGPATCARGALENLKAMEKDKPGEVRTDRYVYFIQAGTGA